MGDMNITNCGYKPTERLGLYIMIIFILLNTCDIDTNQKAVIKKLEKIEKRIELIEKQPIEETNGQFKRNIQKNGKE